MRKILYRGFHTKKSGAITITLNGEKIKGEWVYGCYVYDKQNFSIRGFDCVYESVIPETVGQWVKTDGFCKDVFVGDIVKIEINGRYYKGVVEYSERCTGYVVRTTSGENLIANRAMYLIGNIWEIEDERV